MEVHGVGGREGVGFVELELERQICQSFGVRGLYFGGWVGGWGATCGQDVALIAVVLRVDFGEGDVIFEGGGVHVDVVVVC